MSAWWLAVPAAVFAAWWALNWLSDGFNPSNGRRGRKGPSRNSTG